MIECTLSKNHVSIFETGFKTTFLHLALEWCSTCCGPSFPRQDILVVSWDHLPRQWGLIVLTSWPPPGPIHCHHSTKPSILNQSNSFPGLINQSGRHNIAQHTYMCIVIRIIRVLKRTHLQGSGPSDHIPTYFYPWDFIICGGNPFPECIVHRHCMVLLMLIVLLLAIPIFNQSNISFLVTCLKTSKS